jgi:hypothetical protein
MGKKSAGGPSDEIASPVPEVPPPAVKGKPAPIPPNITPTPKSVDAKAKGEATRIVRIKADSGAHINGVKFLAGESYEVSEGEFITLQSKGVLA